MIHNNKDNVINKDGRYINSDNFIDGNKLENIIDNLDINKVVNNKIDDVAIKEKKIFIKNLFGGLGYTSYKYFISLGNVEVLEENETLLINNLKPFIASLEDSKTYTVLSVIRWINYKGESQGVFNSWYIV